ncbi:MAG: tripartite tricarboxylate transporter TctB family protein [Granulosicoccaceae bacterium]
MRAFIEGLILAFVSALAIWGAIQVPSPTPGETWAGVVPMGAALALLVISIWLTIGGLKVGANAASSASNNKGTIHVVLLFVISIIYQQSLRWFGYVLPTAIVAPVLLYSFGVRSWVGLALSIIVCPLAFHLIFFKLLGVFPPVGEVFDLLGKLQG